MTATKIFGTAANTRETALVAAAMLAVTIAYEYAMSVLIEGFTIHWYEFFGTWCVLNAVWLVRTQNIQNWMWGIAGVVLLGVFFRDIGLPGQQWLQWAYFLPVQGWAWYHWVHGARDRAALPVTTLSSSGRALWLGVLAVGTIAVYASIDAFAPGSQLPILDATVVAASVTAQFLMGRKKVESWLLWLGPVNLISIWLFFSTGAYVLTALYVAFFIHAAFGVRSWWRAANAGARQEAVSETGYVSA